MNNLTITTEQIEEIIENPSPLHSLVMNDCITLNIKPIAKPRMTRSDKWKKRKCVLDYRIFCDELRLYTKRHNFDLGESYKI